MIRFTSAFLVALALFTSGFLAADPLDGITIEPEHDVRYDRARTYGTWTTPESCMSTRMIVLRDESTPSKVKIKKRASGACDVWIGRWKETYVGYVTTDPRKLDIDDLFPLKEALRSGAYKWSKAERREYANYLDDPWHLLAVDGPANRAKGDKAPAERMPSNESFQCAYLEHRVEIKRHWKLSIDQAEADAIRADLAGL